LEGKLSSAYPSLAAKLHDGSAARFTIVFFEKSNGARCRNFVRLDRTFPEQPAELRHNLDADRWSRGHGFFRNLCRALYSPPWHPWHRKCEDGAITYRPFEIKANTTFGNGEK